MAHAAPTGRLRRDGIPGVVLAASVMLAVGAAAAQTAEDSPARAILDAAGLKGGLIVHLGCGDGKLTAALHAGESYLVHGLDADADRVRQAREHIRKLGLYGPVSVERFAGGRLPYADNLANLVVAEDLGGVAMAEVMRVLAPGGTLCTRQGDRWTTTVKPPAKGTDEWTHYLHDAGGNPVAHDTVVGPPRRIQWLADPPHARSHEHIPSINAVVSTGGRIFYILDEGLTASLREPPQWHLVARDAYNGVLLWKRPFSPWFPHIVNWGQTPPQLQRRLVAVGGRVYVTLGLHAPLSAVDAATGQTLKVYDQTQGAEEVLCHKGLLLLAVRAVTPERVAELEEWARLVRRGNSPVYVRETAEPLVKRLRGIEGRAEPAILAMDADTGRLLWQKAGEEAGGLRPGSLCAVGDRVFYQKAKGIAALDLQTGRELWSAAAGPLRVVGGGSLFCSAGETVTALSAETGKALWTQPTSLTDVRDAFVIGSSLWLGGFKPCPEKRSPAWGPYFATQLDLATGRMLKHVEPANPGHHHRCWNNKATERYILGGRRGVEFIDLQTGEVLWHSWVRGVCRYGVMPANGLLYAPSHACGCYIAAKLDGFHALAPAGEGPDPGDQAPREQAAPLETGPAYASIPGPPPAPASPRPAIRSPQSEDWPTYRHDAARSGCTRSAVPAALRIRWQAKVGGKLTSPTVADGRVFVASVDEHTVLAVDADSGRPAWRFTAGARVDSPPTLHDGAAIFGCRDGHVYSLRASDGAVAWRLRAAREDRRIAAWGQLESPTPVHGSVLVQDGAAHFAAGRSSYLDGGIDLYSVQPETGKVLSRTSVYSPDPETGKQPDQYGPCEMPGSLADILAGDGQYVYLRDIVFDKRGGRPGQGNPHLLTLTGFLDDTWPHRSYWIFGTRCSLATGCSGRDKDLIYGRLLVFDDSTIYGYGRAGVHWSNQLQDGPYRLFAVKRGESKPQWTKPVAVQVRAMVLADGILFLAGPRTEAGDQPEGPRGNHQAVLLALSASDGTELASCPLPALPVFDALAAARGRLYVALQDGQVVCLDAKGGT